MKTGQFIAVLFISSCVAAIIAFILMPRIDARAASPTTLDIIPGERAGNFDQPPVEGEIRRSARLSIRPDGHYWARTLVNNKASVEFMVDTGASVVALTYRDAQKIGLKPDTLDYRWKVNTAGGQTLGASVVIDSIKINQVHIRNVRAMVLREDLEQSLLGMSYLNQLYSYEFRGERLIIRQ